MLQQIVTGGLYVAYAFLSVVTIGGIVLLVTGRDVPFHGVNQQPDKAKK